MKSVHITKVVSRNFILDIWAQIQNMFGMNLTVYEKMVDKAMKAVDIELESQQVKLKWFRYEITQLTNGAVSITLYGEKEE